MEGRACRLVAIDPDAHSDDLFDAFGRDPGGALWSYMVAGPFETVAAVRDWLRSIHASDDPMFFAILDKSTGKAVGLASFLRIDPVMGVIEVGNISYSLMLQRTAMATEAMALMMSRVFNDWGYRRYEWKCDALNAPSRRAAERLGFSYEGTFRQALIYKGRNRDTAWFSVIDKEWPALERAYAGWLAPENFDSAGRQKRRLQDFINDARQ